MRKIAATYVYPLTRTPIKNGILLCEDDGTIIEIIDKGEEFREEAGVEHYSGILVPGFVRSNELKNLDKVRCRKMWAEGIVLALDVGNSLFAEITKNEFAVHALAADLMQNNKSPDCMGMQRPIPEHLYAMQEQNRSLNMTELLTLLSLEKARDLGIESQYGSFEPGTRPGINLVTGIDYKRMRFTPDMKIKRLL